MSTTVARIELSPRERQVLQGLADGGTLAAVALDLKLRESTATGYLRLAKQKLYGVSANEEVVAVAYAVEAIDRPNVLDLKELFLPDEQRELVPLIAQGMAPAQMATALKRPVEIVRRDGRALLVNLRARNRPHLVTRAWQCELLTADQVIAWLS